MITGKRKRWKHDFGFSVYWIPLFQWNARTHGREWASKRARVIERRWRGNVADVGIHLHLAAPSYVAIRLENECIENIDSQNFCLCTHTHSHTHVQDIEGTLCTHRSHCVDFVYISGVELCKQSSLTPSTFPLPLSLTHRRANSQEWVCFTNVQIDIRTHSRTHTQSYERGKTGFVKTIVVAAVVVVISAVMPYESVITYCREIILHILRFRIYSILVNVCVRARVVWAKRKRYRFLQFSV